MILYRRAICSKQDGQHVFFFYAFDKIARLTLYAISNDHHKIGTKAKIPPLHCPHLKKICKKRHVVIECLASYNLLPLRQVVRKLFDQCKSYQNCIVRRNMVCISKEYISKLIGNPPQIHHFAAWKGSNTRYNESMILTSMCFKAHIVSDYTQQRVLTYQ